MILQALEDDDVNESCINFFKFASYNIFVRNGYFERSTDDVSSSLKPNFSACSLFHYDYACLCFFA